MATKYPSVIFKDYQDGQFVDVLIGESSTVSTEYTLISSDIPSYVFWQTGYYVVGADYNNDGKIDAEDARYAAAQSTPLPTNFTIAKGVVVQGDAKLILADGFSLTVSDTWESQSYAAIDVSGNFGYGSFTVCGQENGTGSLSATGRDKGAGIGCGYNTYNRSITINGGIITSTGGNGAAGIGGGSYSSGSQITIHGGTVTANGGQSGAGIGGGVNQIGSVITITGGNIVANGGYGGGAGIGGGTSNCGYNISITGGTVITKGGNSDGMYQTGDGIGNGGNSDGNSQGLTFENNLTVKADTGSSISTAPIAHTGTTDLASALSGKQYVEVFKKTYVYNGDWENDASVTWNDINGKVGDSMFFNVSQQTDFLAKNDASKVIINASFDYAIAGQGVDTEVDDGIYSDMFLGGLLADTGSQNTGSYAINIQGGTFSRTACCGDALTGYDSEATVQQRAFSRNGDLTFNVSGGTFQQWIAGGLFYVPEDLSDVGSMTLYGDVNFAITGGQFAGRIYGGCLSRTADLGAHTLIAGSVNLTVNAAQDVFIHEHLVAGSRGAGVITGSVNVTFSGSGDNLHFGENSVVYGGCNSDFVKIAGGTKTVSSVVGKNGEAAARNLVFAGFSGDFGAELRLFGTVTFKDNSAVAFSDPELNMWSIETWNFEFGSSGTGIAANDFSSDTLIFDVAGFTGETWNVLSGNAEGFAELFKSGSTAKVQFDDGQTVTNAEWVTDHWAAGNYELRLADGSAENEKIMSVVSIA